MENKYDSRGLASRIKGERKRLKLTQTQLGKAAGVTKGAVSAWEREGGSKNLRLEHLFAIADKLNVRPRWLALNQGSREYAKKEAVEKYSEEVLMLAEKIAALPQAKRDLLVSIFQSHADDAAVAERIDPAPKHQKRHA